MWVDGFWALLLLGISALYLFAGQVVQGDTDLPSGLVDGLTFVPIALALSAAVALRRKLPEQMLLLATGAGVAQLVADVTVYPGDFALLVIIFTVASRGARWASRFALVGAVAAPSLSAVRWPTEGQDPSGAVFGTIFMTVTFVLAWVLGDSLRTRRAYYAELEERATRLEREREARAKVAVAAERARIARELHDVVAHNVSVMVVQADGAAYVLDSAPEQTRGALETISGTGRQALAEMRRLLGVLRTGQDPDGDAAAYVPQPGVEQLAELVEQVRSAGLTVDFRIEGSPRALPSGVELTAYRVVQEALTNSRKHGGDQVGAKVLLKYGERELTLLAEDDGSGEDRRLHEGGADGLGHGLIGMRERVDMVGGSLQAGPRPGGGFRISAVLPLPEAAEAAPAQRRRNR